MLIIRKTERKFIITEPTTEIKCSVCDGTKGLYRLDMSPHAFRVTCETCGKFIRWSSKQEYEIKFRARHLVEKLFGLP